MAARRLSQSEGLIPTEGIRLKARTLPEKAEHVPLRAPGKDAPSNDYFRGFDPNVGHI